MQDHVGAQHCCAPARHDVSTTELCFLIFEKAWHHVITAEQTFFAFPKERAPWAAATRTSKKSNTPPPRRNYRSPRFFSAAKTALKSDPAKVPYGHNGLPGSILDLSEGIKAGLDHACGGVCACSTCHVIVKQGLESCNEATDAELDELDEAPGITPKSRLGCQTVPQIGTTDMVVEIPEWKVKITSKKEIALTHWRRFCNRSPATRN